MANYYYYIVFFRNSYSGSKRLTQVYAFASIKYALQSFVYISH